MGETEEFLFIVMQLIAGMDLRTIIQRLHRHPVPSRRIMPKKDAIGIMIAVLDALGYAHSQQVIHQDVKPANIIIEERTGRPYLVDFGIARTIFSEQGVSRVISGTPLYMAPEQAAGSKLMPVRISTQQVWYCMKRYAERFRSKLSIVNR
jgi:serine/threonine-protein kinase